ncbi:hypothetical protein GGR51DRAFT_17185 [Nemania sp. FL0031]|nr:hypothetical protein GGR51DRAFT_17185 [Nemania sp. FL0031]
MSGSEFHLFTFCGRARFNMINTLYPDGRRVCTTWINQNHLNIIKPTYCHYLFSLLYTLAFVITMRQPVHSIMHELPALRNLPVMNLSDGTIYLLFVSATIIITIRRSISRTRS